MSRTARDGIAEMMKSAGIADIGNDWLGCDVVWPVLEQMRADGAVILLNFLGVDGYQPYSVNVVGEIMEGQFITQEATNLEDCLASSIEDFAQRFWGMNMPTNNNLACQPTKLSEKRLNAISNVAEYIDVQLEKIPRDNGIDWALPFLTRMKNDGAVVMVKLDGERTNEEDSGPYTVVASGKPLGEECVRLDANSIVEGLDYLIVEYAKIAWSLKPM